MGERKYDRKGKRGSSEFAANPDETSLQGGVTRAATESFTVPAAQIHHPYDRTPLEREVRPSSLTHVRNTPGRQRL